MIPASDEEVLEVSLVMTQKVFAEKVSLLPDSASQADVCVSQTTLTSVQEKKKKSWCTFNHIPHLLLSTFDLLFSHASMTLLSFSQSFFGISLFSSKTSSLKKKRHKVMKLRSCEGIIKNMYWWKWNGQNSILDGSWSYPFPLFLEERSLSRQRNQWSCLHLIINLVPLHQILLLFSCELKPLYFSFSLVSLSIIFDSQAEQTKVEAEQAFEDCTDVASQEVSNSMSFFRFHSLTFFITFFFANIFGSQSLLFGQIKRFHRLRAQALGSALEKYGEGQLVVARQMSQVLSKHLEILKDFQL